MEIRGKNILLTGGLGALGSAIQERLSFLGANLFIFDLKADGKNQFSVNVCDEDEVASALEKIEHIDVLVNCAGEIYSEPCVNMLKRTRHKRDSWERIIQNNLTSCFNMSLQTAQKMMKTRTKGVIINFSSISAQGNAGQIAYAAAKAGVEAMTKTMAKELGLFKIRCCAVAPGFIDTPSTHRALSTGTIDYYTSQTPLKSLGSTKDITDTIEYIIQCDFLNGCVIPVDGALRL